MKSHLQLIPTNNMSQDDWLMYRKTGIGASEVGAIMGLSPYKSSIELFYEKISPEPSYTVENIYMFMGKEQEAFIANLWQYWGGDVESMIANYRAKNIVRKCRRVNAYVRNPKYPWLFVSLDRVMNKTEKVGEGALEIKTIGGWEADKWVAGIPPSHVIQVQTQCLVCEFNFGELATLEDGRQLDVIPFDYIANIGAGVIDKTHDFWQRVEKGRVLINRRYEAQKGYRLREVDECNGMLAELEPEPDGSQAYTDFLKKQFDEPEAGERTGTMLELEAAKNHKVVKAQLLALTEESRSWENKLKKSLGNMETLNFGVSGKVTWRPDVNGIRRFLNNVQL